MANWERIRKDLLEGVSALGGRTADALKDGAGSAGARLAYTSKLAQLNWERRSVEKEMDSRFRELGRLFFELGGENRLQDFESSAGKPFEELAALEQALNEIESRKSELTKTSGVEKIDKEAIKCLRTDLEGGGGTIVQVLLEEGSALAGKALKEITLPKEALIGTILRDEEIIIPDGGTVLQAGDKITVLGKREDVEEVVEQMAGR